MTTSLPGLPALEWTNGAGHFTPSDAGGFQLVADAGVDWTNDASGQEFAPQHAATSLAFAVHEDFQLSARVRVDQPRTTFDAGALCLWADQDHWAKLCFEWSPQGAAMVVSVVTNQYSDDANATDVEAEDVWLRVSKIGPAFAFHSSQDGRTWRFVRLFRLLTDKPVLAGFLAQAPLGDGATATFSDVHYSRETLTELR
jgi:regulation of enolase protein 1 (concanavalin A-like superfamily)